MINFNASYSVVDYALAREILFRTEMGARREADTLLITIKGTGRSLYSKEESCASLYVDEGFYTNTMYRGADGSVTSGFNMPWMELVDYADLLRAICIGYGNAEIPPCEFHGHGRRKDHAIHHYLKNLKAIQESRGIDWFSVS